MAADLYDADLSPARRVKARETRGERRRSANRNFNSRRESSLWQRTGSTREKNPFVLFFIFTFFSLFFYFFFFFYKREAGEGEPARARELTAGNEAGVNCQRKSVRSRENELGMDTRTKWKKKKRHIDDERMETDTDGSMIKVIDCVVIVPHGGLPLCAAKIKYFMRYRDGYFDKVKLDTSVKKMASSSSIGVWVTEGQYSNSYFVSYARLIIRFLIV